MTRSVLYTAAHAGFPDSEPLGGGKAVADFLCRAHPEWTVLSPAAVGMTGLRLTEWGEWRYARFCRQFERAVTRRILAQEPTGCVVLVNDISEGPDFAALGRRGYRVVTIFHVDVVEYFTKFYLRGWVRPEWAARYLSWPGLVFAKQRDAVRWSRRLVVPSAPMKEMILRCYRECAAEKIVVLPWGNIAEPVAPGRAPPPVGAEEVVIMTLSRLSPEKGIERLLRALPMVTGKYRVWICGAAAYMGGRRYERKLRRLANERVEFLGHVTGAEKAAVLQRADVFVSPSRHESYGLTIAEAEAAGCRVISHGHYGARGRMVNCEDPRELAAVLQEEVARGRTVKQPVAVGSDAADRLADVIRQVAAEA